MAGLLRAESSIDDSKVTFVELFFDLVFVFAITQLAHLLLHHFNGAGLAETFFLMFAVWWVWIYTTWVTNWLDPQAVPVRLMIFTLMLLGLLLAISIPAAFADLGIVFAGAYVTMQVGRSLFMCWALRKAEKGRLLNFVRITVWLAIAGGFWIAGGLSHHEGRYALWGVALLIEYASPALGFWTPGLGKSTTTDWDVSGEHMAERCGLFIIIALGESLLVTGATFAKLDWSSATVTAFLTAFVSTVAMWWIYFNIGAERASHRISESEDPGHLARLAYTYLHIPIVAGLILVAASDELILKHPTGHTGLLAAFAILGGPAIFLAGNLLFKRAVFGKFARSHVTGIALLVLAFPVHKLLAPLTLALLASALLVVVAAWETIAVTSGRRRLT